MDKFKVAEIFESINGEGMKAGELSVFVRLTGCNLSCSYCDTSWANKADVPCTLMTADEIYDRVKETGIKNVTLTGGEPLLNNNVRSLLEVFAKDKDIDVEIETNGSIDLTAFAGIVKRPSFTMDYKLAGSGMQEHMKTSNFSVLNENDTVKFVVSGEDDLERALEIIRQFNLDSKCNVLLSPVFGKIDPKDIVEFMKKNVMNNVRMQLQLHKIIWDPDKRGV